MATAEPRTRKSAEERREEILEVAIRHFAVGGYHGTSTEAIAREAGISQPYLFRLFRTKRELFLACCDRSDEQLVSVFHRAAEAGDDPESRLHAMGKAYVEELLPDRHAILMQMQGYVASADPQIQAHVRGNFGRVVAEVARLSGAPAEAVWNFFAHGMLLNTTAALDLDAIAPHSEWAASWAKPGTITGYGDTPDC